MSLKAIHIVFITASTLLAFGFSAWSLRNFFLNGSMLDLFFGVGSLVTAAALIYYGRYFLKKLKNIDYL
ncbi:MAG: hypothetical protein AAB466_15005 [Verrucomicrobiota bacterium]